MLPRGGKPPLDSLAAHVWATRQHDDFMPTKRVLARNLRSHQSRAEEDDLQLPVLPLAADRAERQPAHEMALHQ